MKRLQALLAGIVVLASGACPALALDLQRGAGLHTMMNWAEPGDGPDAYAPEPFAADDYDVSDTLLANMADAGLDFIRLTIDPGPFLSLEGASRDALDEVLSTNIRRLASHGFAVVVDFHPNRQIARFGPEAIVADERGGLFDRYEALLGRTAKLVAGLKIDRLAIELLNEPQIGYSPSQVAQWTRMQKRLHAAVRENAPDLAIIVTGGRSGGIGGLFDLDPATFNDGKTLFSFHYYRPHVFTHQGVKSNFKSIRHLRYFSYLPYPAGTGSRGAAWEAVKLAIDADDGLSPGARHEMAEAARKALDDYFASGIGRGTIDADFDTVLDWAGQHGIAPGNIFLGEFGVRRSYGRFTGADGISRAAWLRDVREAAEARGFAWSYWSVRSYGGFVLVDADGSSALHAPTLRALGLRH